MKKVLIALFAFFISTTAWCQDSRKIKLKDIGTIIFPVAPTSEVQGDDTLYAVRYNSVTYLATAAYAQKSINELLTEHILDSIYNDLIQGALEPMQGKLLLRKKITLNGAEGVSFAFKGQIKGSPYYGYNQSFYLNNTLIDYGIITPDSLKADDKVLTDFFGSFKLIIKPDEVRQSNVDDVSYGAGYLIGKGLFILTICLIGLGIVFLIRRFTR